MFEEKKTYFFENFLTEGVFCAFEVLEVIVYEVLL